MRFVPCNFQIRCKNNMLQFSETNHVTFFVKSYNVSGVSKFTLSTSDSQNLCMFCLFQVIETVSATDKDDFANGPQFHFSLVDTFPPNQNFTLRDNQGDYPYSEYK